MRGNPPCRAAEWAPPLREASDGAAKRQQQGQAAGREIRQSQDRLERQTVAQLLTRLQALRRDLLAAVAGAQTTFRRTQAQALLADVDGAILRVQVDLGALARGAYDTAFDLGDAHATAPIQAAGLIVQTAGALDEQLVAAAYQNTVDLLSAPMQQYRTRIAIQVRQLAVAGTDFGTQWTALTKAIGRDGFDDAAFRAERIIRTELSRTFNAATFARLEEQAAAFPFLRKIWIRTADARTRPSHVQAGATYARGQGIPIPERFVVGRATLRFPVDPLAEPPGRAAAAETIMCRCVGATDFDPAGFRAVAAQRIALALGAPGSVK